MNDNMEPPANDGNSYQSLLSKARVRADEIVSEHCVLPPRVNPDLALVLEVPFPPHLRSLKAAVKNNFREKIISEILDRVATVNGKKDFIDGVFDARAPFVLNIAFMPSRELQEQLLTIHAVSIKEDDSIFVHTFRCTVRTRLPQGTAASYSLENLADIKTESVERLCAFAMGQNYTGDWSSYLAKSLDVPNGYVIEPNGQANAVKIYINAGGLREEMLYRAANGFFTTQSPSGAQYKVYINPEMSLRCECCHTRGHSTASCPIRKLEDPAFKKAQVEVIAELSGERRIRESQRRNRNEPVPIKAAEPNRIPGDVPKAGSNAAKPSAPNREPRATRATTSAAPRVPKAPAKGAPSDHSATAQADPRVTKAATQAAQSAPAATAQREPSASNIRAQGAQSAPAATAQREPSAPKIPAQAAQSAPAATAHKEPTLPSAPIAHTAPTAPSTPSTPRNNAQAAQSAPTPAQAEPKEPSVPSAPAQPTQTASDAADEAVPSPSTAASNASVPRRIVPRNLKASQVNSSALEKENGPAPQQNKRKSDPVLHTKPIAAARESVSNQRLETPQAATYASVVTSNLGRRKSALTEKEPPIDVSNKPNSAFTHSIPSRVSSSGTPSTVPTKSPESEQSPSISANLSQGTTEASPTPAEASRPKRKRSDPNPIERELTSVPRAEGVPSSPSKSPDKKKQRVKYHDVSSEFPPSPTMEPLPVDDGMDIDGTATASVAQL
jgi:hypothetical protein